MSDNSTKLFRPKYCLIPLQARKNKNIPPKAQIYLGELNILTNEYGYCWASDEQLAEMQGVSLRTIEGWHKILEDEGFIKRDTYRKHEVNEKRKKLEIKTERKIYVIDRDSNNFTEPQKTAGPCEPQKIAGRCEPQKIAGITIEPLTKEPLTHEEAPDGACVSFSKKEELKAKKEALEETALFTEQEIVMLMRFDLESILKACELSKEETGMDSPVRWFKACMSQKWWENGRLGKSTKIQKLESLKIAVATAAKSKKVRLSLVESKDTLNISGMNGGLQINQKDLNETKDCIKIARLINQKYGFDGKVIFNELPGKGLFECL